MTKAGRRARRGLWDSGRGTSAGVLIFPLLGNLYVRRFVLGWKKLGLEESLGSHVTSTPTIDAACPGLCNLN